MDQTKLAGRWVVGVVLTAFAGQSAARAQETDSRAAIDARREALMDGVARGDAVGVARVFAADAKLLLPHVEVISGREAIRKFWEVALKSGLKGLELKAVDLDGQGTLLVETGAYVTLGEGAKDLDRGKYVIVWERVGDEWEISRDIANSSLPASARPEAGPATVPAPKEDRVGFPKDYPTKYKVLSVAVRDQEPRVITVYANDRAASAIEAARLPYPAGSILVMEYAYARKDPAGRPALDAEGNVQKGDVDHLDVMRREKGFGEAYGRNRTGDWEYVGYRPDGGHSTPPQKSASCAECHLRAGAAKDFVFRSRVPDKAGR